MLLQTIILNYSDYFLWLSLSICLYCRQRNAVCTHTIRPVENFRSSLRSHLNFLTHMIKGIHFPRQNKVFCKTFRCPLISGFTFVFPTTFFRHNIQILFWIIPEIINSGIINRFLQSTILYFPIFFSFHYKPHFQLIYPQMSKNSSGKCTCKRQQFEKSFLLFYEPSPITPASRSFNPVTF